ncbi:phage holin family protein [Jeotgalibacillus haloalkalitolerans]|uniref:Phage holin family protein n=1 Tax=Jeotgalibacillus haloalkalitolerans TaxID=3104292 RepID=A0ABU5KL48_9BACL|nr:phage holin family protein [Jeotgalibacillus sp. HH7-29]MDZ5711671.1 phage holin family protein [Jeotgalibacillus sp. HH7-29]
MQHSTDTAYAFFWGGGFSVVSYLIGGWDNLIVALSIFMIVDYITGIMIGINDRKLNSKIAFKGIMKKAAMFLAIIVAVQLDSITGDGEGYFIRYTLIMFLIGMEGISIVENMGHLGIKLPAIISERFAQLREEPEKKREDDAS